MMEMMKKTIVVLGVLTMAASAARAGFTRAVAVLSPTEGHDVSGTVVFTQVEGGVRVVAEVDGLTPGKHGFHIHQYGDCSAPDGTAAGGHFDPYGAPHGDPETNVRHAGDLGNIEADEEGHATYDRVDGRISLNGPATILGRAVIVHAGEDDLVSQPTGAAGARVACGAIGIAKMEAAPAPAPEESTESEASEAAADEMESMGSDHKGSGHK